MLWAYTIHPLEKKSDHRGWSGHIPNTSDSVPSFACRGCPRNVHVSNRAKLGVTFTQASHLHIVGQLRLIGELTVRSLTDPFKKKSYSLMRVVEIKMRSAQLSSVEFASL